VPAPFAKDTLLDTAFDKRREAAWMVQALSADEPFADSPSTGGAEKVLLRQDSTVIKSTRPNLITVAWASRKSY
jgi:hypothetical protein